MTLWAWGGFLILILALLAVDLLGHRGGREPRLRESAAGDWSFEMNVEYGDQTASEGPDLSLSSPGTFAVEAKGADTTGSAIPRGFRSPEATRSRDPTGGSRRACPGPGCTGPRAGVARAVRPVA